MINLYYCSSIDINPKEALKQIEKFKGILSKYNINVFGAGIDKDSSIIDENSTLELKGVVCAYDLRKIRESDILLFVTDLSTFCPGSCMELEYARQLGLYVIVLCLANKDFVKNIFIETYANKIIYSVEELEFILEDIVGKKK